MESRRVQGTLIPRSCAISGREPCQSLTAAALSDLRDVPRGSFGVVTYTRADSVKLVGVGAHFLKKIAAYIAAFLFLYKSRLGILTLDFRNLFYKVSKYSCFLFRQPISFLS